MVSPESPWFGGGGGGGAADAGGPAGGPGAEELRVVSSIGSVATAGESAMVDGVVVVDVDIDVDDAATGGDIGSDEMLSSRYSV